MLPDWRVPAGQRIYMKEASEQVVELFLWRSDKLTFFTQIN
jgi:hypothetical protein